MKTGQEIGMRCELGFSDDPDGDWLTCDLVFRVFQLARTARTDGMAKQVITDLGVTMTIHCERVRFQNQILLSIVHRKLRE
jgi:hypothetical protein